MGNIAIITARGGSKRIPKKNIKDFLGKPIIVYSIEAALESSLFDEVMVSTDDLEIAEISKRTGANVPFLRSEKNSDDFASTTDVIEETLIQYSSLKNQNFENACCIYPTAPFITSSTLTKSFELFIANHYDTLFPVLEFTFPIHRAWYIEDGLAKMFWPEYLRKRSQDLPKAYHDAGQFYWIQPKIFFEKKLLFTDNSGVFPLSSFDAHDIDTIEDWDAAEFKYQLRKKMNKT